MMIDKLFIGLDLSKYDEICIQNAYGLLNHITTIKKVVLYHNIKFDFIGELDSFTQLNGNELKEKILNHIKKKYIPRFKEHQNKIIPTVTDKNNTISAIQEQLANTNSSTLFIFGSKTKKDGTGDVPLNVASLNSFSSPVMFCPYATRSPFKSLYAAIDIKRAKIDHNVIKWANGFRKFYPDLEVTGVYIIETPKMYFPYFDKADDKISDELWNSSKAKFTKLTKSYEDQVDAWHFRLLKGRGAVQQLNKVKIDEKPDILVVGKNSNYLKNSNILGSTARKILLNLPEDVLLVMI